MTRIRVGVVRGGPEGEAGVSIKTGAAVLANLPQRYIPRDIFIDRNGIWHLAGKPVTPARALGNCDVVFNALHGLYGEGGKVQRIFDDLHIPHTSSDTVSSALAMHKWLAKRAFKGAGLRTPYAAVVSRDTTDAGTIRDMYRRFPQPAVVKPVDGGSSLGVRITSGFHDFADAVDQVLSESRAALIEEHVRGREATCGVLERFRNEKTYALPPVEIIPAEGGFFDFDAKYGLPAASGDSAQAGGTTQEICPSSFPNATKREIEHIARRAHDALGLRHYSRTDVIVSPKRGIYVLEVNSQPGLTEQSLMPKACEAVGCSFPQLVDHLLGLALKR